MEQVTEFMTDVPVKHRSRARDALGRRRDLGFAADHRAPVPLLSNPLLERRLRRHAASRFFHRIIAALSCRWLEMSSVLISRAASTSVFAGETPAATSGASREKQPWHTSPSAIANTTFLMSPVLLGRSWPYSAALLPPA